MKKKIISLAAALVLAVLLASNAFAVGPAAASEAYIVMDADTGQVLLSSNMDVPKNPASITKILTMALACQKAQGDWSAQLTVSHDAVYSLYRTGSSHIALQEGEVVSLADMLYAAEMVSANDAANVLAEYVGGTIEGGVAVMNALVAEMGLQNTHFTNPHGITDAEHYVSAYDMAVILRWALQQPGFEQLFCENNMYTMQPTNLQSQVRYFSLKDYIRIGSKSAYVSTVIGSKTGYTDDARYTYACLAEQDGVRLICVVLHSQLRTEKFSDVKQLLNYAFSSFHRETVPAGGQAAELEVMGGGSPLGTLSLDAPGASLLLHNNLTLANVQTGLRDAQQYVLGSDTVPQAVYAVDGGGLQESWALCVPVQLTGLEELLAAHAGEELPAGADVTPDKRAAHSGPIAAAVVLALAAAVLALVRYGRKAGRVQKPKS